MKANMKKFVALILTATVLAVSLCPTDVLAKTNKYIDGDTPDGYNNRVESTDGQFYAPSVQTNFHAPEIKSLIPVSPKPVIDANTGVSVSQYEDAKSVFFIDDNDEYGDLAKAALNNAVKNVNGTIIATVTINLFKYEGKAYKSVLSTTDDIQFMTGIPKKFRANGRDYAMIRLNADGTCTYLTDMDNDSISVTFNTNYFALNSLYALVYAPHGSFDAYKPAPVAAQ